jgi:hypothetical protein
MTRRAWMAVVSTPLTPVVEGALDVEVPGVSSLASTTIGRVRDPGGGTISGGSTATIDDPLHASLAVKGTLAVMNCTPWPLVVVSVVVIIKCPSEFVVLDRGDR